MVQVWQHRWDSRRATSLRDAWGPPVQVEATTFRQALLQAADALTEASKRLHD